MSNFFQPNRPVRPHEFYRSLGYAKSRRYLTVQECDGEKDLKLRASEFLSADVQLLFANFVTFRGRGTRDFFCEGCFMPGIVMRSADLLVSSFLRWINKPALTFFCEQCQNWVPMEVAGEHIRKCLLLACRRCREPVHIDTQFFLETNCDCADSYADDRDRIVCRPNSIARFFTQHSVDSELARALGNHHVLPFRSRYQFLMNICEDGNGRSLNDAVHDVLVSGRIEDPIPLCSP